MYKPKRGLWTSEDVSPQHPDRAMDFVADYILDKYVELDPMAHVAVDGTNKNDWVVLTGEISSTAEVDIENAVKEAYRMIGYEFEPRIINLIYKQSPDIAMGIEKRRVEVVNQDMGSTDTTSYTNEVSNIETKEVVSEIGAGDQGIMIGYANIESDEYLPLALYLSKRIISRLYEAKRHYPYLKGDMKAQVIIDYDKEEPEVHTVVVACQHTDTANLEDLRETIKDIVNRVFIASKVKVSENLIWHINGTGKFVIGGPEGDSGEVGRKLICDSYGGYAAIGGGNTHGKDATKVDASAAYATRWLAKNIVASGLSDECEVQLGYVIGVAEPVSINVDLKGQQRTDVTEEDIEKYIKENISLSVKGIIDRFNLRRPLRHDWSRQGYTGDNSSWAGSRAPWEELDLVPDLKKLK